MVVMVSQDKSRVEESVGEGNSAEETLQFETGSLSKGEIDAILETLPVDITFVDREDRVKYFNKAGKRIFVRTKAVLGRKVQLCHPKKSIHIVNMILEAFRRGEKDSAEFWINMKDRLIYIRYFAVRNRDGEYLGTLEVTQDITEIKKIKGEKRLLDWKM
ncbi:MAG: histidine kinase [Candidatus Bathyarchaeota archaeon B26-1]|nr:MAG: histidine kinase [Candidatus Bathyarchaeota archaeon B26-1]